MDASTKQRIEQLIGSSPVFVFMKGNKLMPQCGFSNNVVQILNALAVPFETFDVLSDAEIRNGIKSDLLEAIAQDFRIPLDLSELKDLISSPLDFAGLARQQCEAIVTKILDITTDQVIAAKYLPSTIR